MTVCLLANGLFFMHNFNQKEVITLRDWKERLIRCGIPEKTANQIVDFFFKNRRTIELIAYVRMTEEATRT